MRKYRTLINVFAANHDRIGFTISVWDGGKKKFYASLPKEFHGKVSAGDYMYTRTEIGSNDYRTMTFECWEYPKQMTKEELDKFWKKIIKKGKQ